MCKIGTITTVSAALTALLAGMCWPQHLAAEDEPSEGWQTTISVGFNLTSGNSETMLGNASVAGEMTHGKNVLRLGIDGSYGESEIKNDDGATGRETTAQSVKAFAHYKRVLDRAYGYLDSSMFHDDIAELEYRVLAGVGPGYTVLKRETSLLAVEAGVVYIWEEVGEVEDAYPGFRFGERYEWNLSKTAKTWESVEYIPKTDDFDDYLINAEAGVEAALNARKNLRLVAQDKYDSTPAEDKEKNDLSVTAALTWKL